jgi:hypothetical protein
MGNGNADGVACRSDYEYAQRPTALQWEEQRLEVSAVEAEWRSPSGHTFRVLTTGGRRFELCYDELQDEWRIIPL